MNNQRTALLTGKIEAASGNRFPGRWLLMSLLLGSLLAPLFAQDTPKPKPKPKPSSEAPATDRSKRTGATRRPTSKTAKQPDNSAGESKPAKETATSSAAPSGPTILLRADADCKIKIDGKLIGNFSAGESRQLPVGLGQRLIEADSSDGRFHWEQIVEIKTAGQVIVSTNLRGEVAKAEEAERQAAEARARAEAAERAKRFEFVKIPAGEFMMGDKDDGPIHRVKISQGFEIGKYEVTQALWEAVMGNNPSRFKGSDLPVETVSWEDAQQFISQLNSQDKRYQYRLPTEAEWEYACRAGTTGDYAGNLYEMAWYENNSGNQTHPVGQKKPNAWGLYDMHGNVWEWCADWYDSDYYRNSPTTDPQGPSTGSSRVHRGGVWASPPRTAGRRIASTFRPAAATATWASASSGHYARRFYPLTLCQPIA